MFKRLFVILAIYFCINLTIQKRPKLTAADIKKIKKGLFLDSYMLSQNELFYNNTHSFTKAKTKQNEKEKLKEENSPRKLTEDEITLNNLGFFSYDLGYARRVIWSYNNLFEYVNKDTTKYILYPYSFTYQTKYDNDTIIENTQNKGGFFTLSPSILPTDSHPHTFQNIKDITSVQVSKSKALYDIDIGILTYETTYEGSKINLFSEADQFCTFFVQKLSKVSECARDLSELSDLRKENPNKGNVMLISPSILNNKNFVFKNDINKFGLLIIPDHVYDTEDIIINALTSNGINKIKQFVENGGNILATGKSGLLLEKFGLVNNGFYKTGKYLYSLKSTETVSEQAMVRLTGCEGIPEKKPSEQPDHFKQVMCMNMDNKIFLTSAYTMDQTVVSADSNWNIIMSLNSADIGSNLKYKDNNGNDIDITSEENYFPIVLSKQEEGKGRIIIINGNLFVNTDYTFQLITDSLFYSMGKNVIFDAYIKYSEDSDSDLPIPGGEEGVRLNCYFKFLNMFETDINDITVDIFIALKTEFITVPDGCQKIKNDKKTYSSIEDMDINYYIRCSLTKLSKYSEFSKEITIEITDQSVTQKATEIPIFHPFLKYTDASTNEQVSIDHGSVLVTASLSAILRVTANPSPGGRYPLRGRGLFFDQVFNVENKENTEAKNVNLITIIPLISLVVGGSDQTGVIHTVEFYDEYYKTHEYKYPWTQTGADIDYIDYAELSDKDILFSTDWDHPVKQFKVERSDLTNNVDIKNLYEVNGNLEVNVEESSLLKGNNQILLKEMFFKDGDLFYEVAKQRKLVFIDTSQEKGAQTYYKGEIPEEEKDPANPSRAKINPVFSRLDLYFKYDKNYQIPENVKDNMAFTVDKYEHEPTTKTDRAVGNYNADRKVNEGFDSNKNDGKLIPDEFYNVLKQHNKITELIDPLDTSINISERFPDMKLSHYLVLIKGDRITRAGSIEGFIEDSDAEENYKTGYLEKYPSVKFIFAHTVSFLIKKSMTRLGGKLIINLGNVIFKDNKIPSENEFITLSVDGVAIYKIEYDYEEGIKNIITAFFKRGLMPDETNGKDSTIQLNVEHLDSRSNIEINIELYELKYDLSKKETNFETYVKVNEFETSYTLTYEKFWSLPCLIIENKFKRNDSTKIKEYELIDPYARYTLYYQELISHRTVWGTTQSNHFTNPGLQAPHGGFSLIGNIGTSSIPFADYVSHGTLMIPSAISTSRIEWEDVWGRHWAQPIRSLFPDVPPLPSPYMDFMMSTTYEIIQNNNRVLEWASADSASVRVHIKFFNNYFKYFNLALCKDNAEITGTKETDYVTIKNSNVYGTCYQNTEAFLSGRKITTDIIDQMSQAMLCADSGNSDEMLNCTERLKALNLPLLIKKGDDQTLEEGYRWNYSPNVDKYYPKGYINEETMWEMTKTDYASDVYYKGYPWHFDNTLPGLDGNQKPQNLMAFPIFKGFGYKMDYSPTKSVYHRYNDAKGWWCDNLQNKDYTLLAGQSTVNTFPTINKTLLSSNDWINGKEINSNVIKNRLKNRYVCEFNQHRIKINPDTFSRIVYPKNIFQNNIIPIYPEIDEKDYTEFDCSKVYQYSPSNISLADNRIRTNTDRDWLYFALNLRAEAKEALNILLSLEPFSDRYYEGETKIQDGGRFSYWNPALGENAYIYLDNNVNVVRSFRVDYTLDCSIYPTSLNTFKTVNYHLFTIEDPKEELREYKSSTYTNTYGFGDSAVSIYVGGTEDSNFKIKPGESTYVKITFYNNAGFDWNMKGGAIEKEGLDIPSDKLMKEYLHTVKVPSKYNFLELEIPSQIKDYIDIIPSDHNKDVESQFFDFQSINVVTIRDGFQGEYFYKLTLKSGLDEKYFGRIWEIKVKINYDYFDMLPGSSNDPSTKVKYGPFYYYHDYTLKVPSIKFGIPYSSSHSNSDYRNKVFYTIGQGTDIKIISTFYNEISLDDIKILTLEEIDKIEEASSVDSNFNEELLKIWNSGISNTKSYLTGDIPATVKPSKMNGYNTLTIDLSKVLPCLPYEVYGEPDITKYYVLVKLSAAQFTYGSRQILNNAYVSYNDSRKIRNSNSVSRRYINVYGPWMKMDITNTLLDYKEQENNFINKENQNEIGENGYMLITITSKNTGSKDAYQTSYKFVFSKYVTLIEDFGDLLNKKDIITIEKDQDNGDIILSINSNRQIPQNTKDAYNIYIKFDFEEEISTSTIYSTLPNERILDEDDNEKVILKSADVKLCQNVECNNEDSFVNQIVNINFKITRNTFPVTNDDTNNEKDEKSEDKSSITWIAAPIVIGIVIIGIGIFLYLDYKKHILFFRNKHESLPSSESKENTEDVKRYNIKNQSNDYV